MGGYQGVGEVVGWVGGGIGGVGGVVVAEFGVKGLHFLRANVVGCT